MVTQRKTSPFFGLAYDSSDTNGDQTIICASEELPSVVCSSKLRPKKLFGSDCALDSQESESMGPFRRNDLWHVLVAYFVFIVQSASGIVHTLGIAQLIHWLMNSTKHSAPPPAICALAIIALISLVCHPEGTTWVILRSIRHWFNAMTSTSFWSWILHDYGSIVSTLLALTTFACLAGIVWIINRNIRTRKRSSRPNQQASTPPNRKKKKKKGARNQHRKQKGTSKSERSSNVIDEMDTMRSQAGIEETEQTPNSPQATVAVTVGNSILAVDDLSTPEVLRSTLPSLPENELVMDEASSTQPMFVEERRRTTTVESLSNDDLSSFGSNSTVPTSMPPMDMKKYQQHPERVILSSKTKTNANSKKRAMNKSKKSQPKPGSKGQHIMGNGNNFEASSRWDSLKPSSRVHSKRAGRGSSQTDNEQIAYREISRRNLNRKGLPVSPTAVGRSHSAVDQKPQKVPDTAFSPSTLRAPPGLELPRNPLRAPESPPLDPWKKSENSASLVGDPFQNDEDRIVANLEELGGQMVDSVLDFE